MMMNLFVVLLLVGLKIGAVFMFSTFLNENERIVVVCFQKDDLELLPFWIEYHASLFGIKNIVVLDNYSTSKETLITLEKWSNLGLHVMYNQGPYAEKGKLTAAAFKSLNTTHEIGIPLDVDEFLVSYRNGIPFVNRTMILEDVHTFLKSNHTCQALRHYYLNYCGGVNNTLLTTEYVHAGPTYSGRDAKKIVNITHLDYLDHGNHNVFVQNAHGSAKCRKVTDELGLLHYHYAEPRVRLRKAIADCVGFGYLPANMTEDNLHLFKAEVDAQRGTGNKAGVHKLRAVIKAFDEGIESLRYSIPPNNLIRVGTLRELVEAAKQ